MDTLFLLDEDVKPFEWIATAACILDKVAMLNGNYRESPSQ